MKPASYSTLHCRADRLTAHIAARARLDTIYGGALASVFADRLHANGWTDLRDVVADVYSASTGRHHRQHEAWQCPECGQSYLGQDAALACCTFEPEEDEESEFVTMAR